MIAGAFFGATGVLFGAFGAHALIDQVSSRSLHSWETAVNYQLLHALALLAVAVLGRQAQVSAHTRALTIAGWSFLAGIVLFSGSLYVLVLTGLTLLGPVTPLGGLAFILGWLALAVAAIRS